MKDASVPALWTIQGAHEKQLCRQRGRWDLATSREGAIDQKETHLTDQRKKARPNIENRKIKFFNLKRGVRAGVLRE
jgi:hypothetical protein